ncbi:MFS transporter [Auritidibacter ignavus]|uniref:MFS transporter n=1 Tax=Auritidibacter ignavus TaxID=678932 RepID=UPI00244D0935|nr:MFS transporter [Auritidibacter ignavus]WGH80852.1 MFS transporter [Auritidibacter ignavus]WGH90071.1 MFS transporter [Auritidibacter ignavus]WHS29260.1 MFS transporter [Auritidibacter ignavus]WHS36090.1 MFS transporter [Auritidibacter ignavus]
MSYTPVDKQSQPEPHDAELQVDSKDVSKIAWAAFAGTALEWYDYFLFGTAAAIVFNHLIFTDLNPAAGAMASLATFGVGFAARPIGAFVFGYLGDRFGRRPTLILSIVLIGVATGIIGFLPTYETAGLWAPTLLVILRLFQGLAVGGEWGGATTIAIEHAPPEKRGRYAAMVQLGSPVGTLLSSGVFALILMLPAEAVDSWGWRLAFWAAFPLLAIALWIRLKVEESPVYEELTAMDDRPKTSAFAVFQKAWGRLLIAIMAAFLGVGGFYVLNTYVISYATTNLGVERQSVVNATLVAAVVQIIVVLIFGRVAEKWGPGRVTFIGGLLTAAAAWPLFILIDTGSMWAIAVAISIGIGLVTITYAVTGSLLAELFPADVRYSGVALGYNLAGALSGFLPFIASWMTTLQEEPGSMPAIIILAVVSLITAIGGFVGEKLRVTDDVTVRESH